MLYILKSLLQFYIRVKFLFYYSQPDKCFSTRDYRKV